MSCQSAAADEPKTDQTPFDTTTALLPAIQVDSLTLTPVVTTQQKPDADVVTLDEAFAQKLVSIKEKQDESVNQLTLTNKATRPLFLLAGEVIIGGKQDRIIGANTIIAANTTQVVPVFCVEHGRWTEGETGREFSSGKALAHGRLRGRASYEGQQEVWNEVSEKNNLRKTGNSTDTYRQVAQQQTTTLGKQEARIKSALAQIPAADRADMIGYVIALDGKVATVDLFNSPKLFRKLEDKLVRSYLTESIDVVATKDNHAPTPAEIKSFMAETDKAKEEPSYENAAASTVRYKADKSAKSQVIYKPSKSMGKMAKPEAPVYENYQKK
jgi:hypothetical protein